MACQWLSAKVGDPIFSLSSLVAPTSRTDEYDLPYIHSGRRSNLSIRLPPSKLPLALHPLPGKPGSCSRPIFPSPLFLLNPRPAVVDDRPGLPFPDFGVRFLSLTQPASYTTDTGIEGIKRREKDQKQNSARTTTTTTRPTGRKGKKIPVWLPCRTSTTSASAHHFRKFLLLNFALLVITRHTIFFWGSQLGLACPCQPQQTGNTRSARAG
jgi:hypothetical protein